MSFSAMRTVPGYGNKYSLFKTLHGQEGLVPNKTFHIKFRKEENYNLAILESDRVNCLYPQPGNVKC